MKNIIDVIMEKHNCTYNDAKCIFENLDFLQYTKLLTEANIDKATQTQGIISPAAKDSAKAKVQTAQPVKPVTSATAPTGTTATIPAAKQVPIANNTVLPDGRTVVSSDTMRYLVKDKNGAQTWVNKTDISLSEDNELSRLQELAGIAETSSCGGTSAAGIATVPSTLGTLKRPNVIGDVAHTPSDKLRKKNRENRRSKTHHADRKKPQA